jgi:hypothetical protein
MSERSRSVRSSGRELLGREREREVLHRLLDGGRRGVLVVHGEAGVGKTALLEYAIAAGPGFGSPERPRSKRTSSFPSRWFSKLCSPFLPLLDRLPEPQREALGVAFGLIADRTHPAPDRRVVSAPVG